MRRFMLVLALIVLAPVAGSAQVNSVPTFSWGPTASAFAIRFSRLEAGAIDAKFGMLSEGLGVSFNLNNVVQSDDGTMSWIGFKFPVYPQIFDSEFALALGGEISFFNNLLGIGAAVDAVNTATDRGFIIGEVDAEDVMVTFSLGFNLGSGGTSSPSLLKAAAAAGVRPSPPFNFVSLSRW